MTTIDDLRHMFKKHRDMFPTSFHMTWDVKHIEALFAHIDAQAAEITRLTAENAALQRDIYTLIKALGTAGESLARADKAQPASAPSAAPATRDDDLGKFLRNASPENKADYGRLLAEASHAEARTEAPASAAAKPVKLTAKQREFLQTMVATEHAKEYGISLIEGEKGVRTAKALERCGLIKLHSSYHYGVDRFQYDATLTAAGRAALRSEGPK